MRNLICNLSAILLAAALCSNSTLAQSPGNALDFDGGNDYVNVPDAAALDITSQITMEAWFKSASSSWPYKKLVSVDYTKVLATQTNFPVLISLTDAELKDSDNGGYIQPDGDDILFLGPNGTTYPHEIEEYDGTTGQLIAWVRVPTLSSVANTEFYLYYGNPNCVSQQDAANVWSENYAAVFHMSEDQVGTTLFEDDFENTADWDAQWDLNGTSVSSWLHATDQFYGGSYSASAIDKNEGLITSDDINTSSATYINVDFWFRKNSTESTDFNLYFYNGSTYDLIANLDTMGNDDTWIHFNEIFTEAQYRISNFRIRFEATLTGNEFVWVDDLKVIADGPEFPESVNGNDGTKSGITETTGYISNAQSFDGVDDRVHFPDVLNSPTQVSLSAWVKHDINASTTERYVDLSNTFVIRHDGQNSPGQLHFYIRTSGETISEIRVNNSMTATDTWYYVTGTYDGSTMKLYLDGQEVGSYSPPGTLNESGLGVISQQSETMDGVIDEVRVSSVGRDSSWIATEYNNMTSPGTFLSLGSQTFVGTNKSSAYGISTNNANAYATINDQIISASITADQWNHICLTYDQGAGGTDEIKLYVNGTQSATGDYSTLINSNTSDLIFGDMAGFWGTLEELRLWNDIRTVEEIRLNMHRVVTPGSEANLVGYWQFNESSGTSASDSKGSNTGTLTNMTDADWVTSTAPLGGGTANDTTNFSSGITTLGNFSMNMSDAFDFGVDITSTEISNAPNVLPAAANPLDDRYWVVDVFGTPGTYAGNVTFTLPEGYLDLGDEANLKLYHRSSNSDAAWNLLVDGAALITTTTVTFNGVNTLGQFSLAGSGSFPMPVEMTSFTGTVEGSNIILRWITETEVTNYGFDVQRAFTEDDWEVIGFVEGHGNSNSPKHYEFVDDLSDIPDHTLLDSVEYRLKQIDLDGKFEYHYMTEPFSIDNITGIEDELIPVKFELYQNYPNPFNPASTIKFALPESGKVQLEIFNSLGQKVAELVNSELTAGYHEVVWNASGYSSGIYLYKISTGKNVDIRKMVLLK